MTRSHRLLVMATAVAAGFVVAVPLAVGTARAESANSLAGSLDPGFDPDTGQINPGVAEQGASQSTEVIEIPTPQEVRAAMKMPVSTQPSTGEAPANPSQPAGTTGAAMSSNGVAAPPANGEPPPSGPIGAIGQTLPAKFSKRNDILDRVPIMAWPLSLSDQQRQQIYRAVMADNSPPAPGADALMPASALTIEQGLTGMHALPASVRDIANVKGLAYVKGKKKVLLVEPATRIVVDEIAS